MPGRSPTALNVAVAKKLFSDLVGRVAYGGETILITRRGKPMAKLVPVRDGEDAPHLGNVKGWLTADDPYFAAVEKIVGARSHHRPRVLPHRRRSTSARA
jgi:prevent-host-death family protein